ncbi:g6814 [Coccomyxa elongata]
MGSLVRGLVLLSLVAAACAASVEWHAVKEPEHHVAAAKLAKANPRAAFSDWVEHLEKAYKDNVEEYERRFSVWLDNLNFVHAHNEKESSFKLGLTNFADLTHDEYRQHALGYRPELKGTGLGTGKSTGFKYADYEAPPSIDWRKKGAVTEVKNQQQCGSCWAFSTTGSVEGANAIYSGDLVSLSEQELVDCDTTQDHGCHGGLMDFAFSFIIRNGGIDTEKDYKYKAQDGVCNIAKEKRHVVTIDSYEDVPPNDESALKKAAANQPISVAIEADQREFQLYAGGVFDAPCGTALDHGVLVVGYGSDNGSDYWIVKNSWGDFWGDSGYIRLARGIANSAGQCGIAMQASYPIKKTPNPPTPPPVPPPAPGPPTPPSPKPEVCDTATSCPPGSTCCCMREFFGYCFTWACCPLKEATCCDDHEHCCPSNLPVCDTIAGRCLSGNADDWENSVPWVSKVPAKRTPGRSWIPHVPFWREAEYAHN